MEIVMKPMDVVPSVLIEDGTSNIHIIPSGYYFPKLEFMGVAREVQKEFIDRLVRLYNDTAYLAKECEDWKLRHSEEN